MITKSYSIKNINFKLKTDLTLDEAEEVQELFKNLFIREDQFDGGTWLVSGNFSNSEIKKFLSIALEPVELTGKTESRTIDEFDFGKAKESEAIEVIKDFFLHRIKKYQDFPLSYAESIKQQ